MRVLFTTQPGHGHLQPMAPYALALADSGDDVRVATAPGFHPAVVKMGLQPIAAGCDFTWERPTDRFPQLAAATTRSAMGEVLREIVFEHCVPSVIEDLKTVIASWTPDLIVHEAAEHGAVFIARLTGIPLAAAAWGAPFSDPLWEKSILPRAITRGQYDRQSAALGLEQEGGRIWDTELTLSTLPPSWMSGDLDGRPPMHHFRMPPLDGASAHDAWNGPSGDERPLIYATLGTVYGWDRELRSMILDAVGDLDADVVMTVGRGVEASRIAAPPNVRIESYVPQSMVLPNAAAVVSHAGLGTMIGAIAAGVPMVLVDLGADHSMNASRAAEVGVAESFTREEVDVSGLRSAIERVLSDERYSSRAQALADEYARLPPSVRAVDVLHGYVEAGSPTGQP